MLSAVFKAVIRKAILLFSVLVLILNINLMLPQSAGAYSLQELAEKAAKVGGTVSSNALQAGRIVTEVATDMGGAIGSTASEVGKVTARAALDAGLKAGSVGLEAGKVTANAVVDIGGSVGDKALHIGKAAAGTAMEVGSKVGSAALEVSKDAINSTTEVGAIAVDKTLQLIGQATQGLEQATNTVAQLVVTSFEKNAQPLLEFAIQQVDLNKIQAEIDKARQDHPEHTPIDLAHYFIGQKTIESSTSDGWVDIARFQAEMVYQVAGVYGFNLQEVSRKSEIMEISAAGLGSSRAIQASMFLLKLPVGQIPVAGDLINMGLDLGSEQVITYLMFQFLGNEACKYYAAHANTALVPDVAAIKS